MVLREILRRSLLLAGLVAGLWLAAWPPGGLLRVEPIDWQTELVGHQRQADEALRLLGPLVGQENTEGVDLAPETRGDLVGFIAHETEGREVAVRGQEWEGFFNAVAATVLGQPPSAGWRARLARGLFEGSLYFDPDEAPLSEVAARLAEPGNYVYIRIDGAARSEYLGVVQSGRDDIASYAPPHLAFPGRRLGLWLLLAGLLAYAVIPWPHAPKEGLWYSRVRLIDGLGCGLVAAFFLIPILVTASNGAGATPFSEGWIFLTGVCWLLAALGACLLGVAAWQGALQLELRGEELVYRTLFRRQTYRVAEVARVDVVKQELPKGLRWALWILALFNWRALGSAAALSVPHFAFRFTFEDGHAEKLAREGIRGMAPLLGRLRDRGVEIAPDAYELLGLEPTDPAFNGPFAPPRPDWIGGVVLLAVIGGLAYGLVATRPPAPAVVQPGAFGPVPFALPAEEETAVTPGMLAEEERILEELAQLSARLKDIEAELPSADEARRQALVEEANGILERVQELEAEFDRVRAPVETPAP